MTTLARSVTGRGVHLRILPRPSSVGESREILRYLSQFGDIEYFKNLKYDALPAHNTALVIFKDEAGAEKCLRHSPIRCKIGKAQNATADVPMPQPNTHADPRPQAPAPTTSAINQARGPSSLPFGIPQHRAMSTSPSHDPVTSPSHVPFTQAMPGAPPRPAHTPFQSEPAPLRDERAFQISVNPSRIHFRDQIDVGQYHSGFMLDGKGVPHVELSETVPLRGLSRVDWKTGGKPWRLVERERKRERTGPRRVKTLRELHDEGRNEDMSPRYHALI